MGKDLHFLSASALARAILRREVSSVELLDHFEARVREYNPVINAIVATDFDSARELARAADESYARGEIWGPLHGVPMTIKDAFAVQGLPSTGGIPELANYVPEENAVAVDRLDRAGAIIFGKTNVPYASGDLQTYNDIYGTTNNPWDVTRGPGGSSGGAAAAIAAGLTGLELGSDIGGSIRTPAHLCGVFGHKSTFGIVPKIGHLPPLPGTLSESDLSVAGPIARSAEDLALALSIVAGPHGAEANGWALDLPAPRAAKPSELRVAVWIEDPYCDIDSESAALLVEAARALEKAGARVDWKARPAFTLAESDDIYLQLLHAGITTGFPASLRARLIERAATLSADDRSHEAQQARGAAMSFLGWRELIERRAILKARWTDFFRDYDVVLAPVLLQPAFAHDQAPNWGNRRLHVNGRERNYMDVLTWAGPAVVAHLPATVAPVGLTSAGLPVGIQIIGPLYGDYTTIAVASMFEEILGGFRAPPGY